MGSIRSNLIPWKFCLQEKEPETEKNVPKRKRRRQQVQEGKQISRLQVCYFSKGKKMSSFKCPFICSLTESVLYKQKIVAAMKWLLLIVTLVVVLIAIANYGYKGLMWLSDWMNEVEEQRQRRTYRRV